MHSKSNVTLIKTRSDTERESAMDVLRAAESEIVEGRVRGIAIAISRPDGAISYMWSTAPLGPLLGAVGLLMHRLASTEKDVFEDGGT